MPNVCGYFEYGYVNYIINMPCKCMSSNSYILKKTGTNYVEINYGLQKKKICMF
jgi:hypothetical protein